MNIQTNEGLPDRPRRALGAALVPNRLGAVATARRHTVLVRILRVALPLCALGVLGLFFVSSKLAVSLGDMQASVGKIEINRDRLRMVNPRLENVTDDGGAYVLTADYAEQNMDDLSTLQLYAVRAELTQPGNSWSRLSAPNGTFHSKKETLELFGGIEIASSSGMTARLERADVDLKSQSIRSQVPVRVDSANGNLTAKSLEIRTGKRRILFTGDIRVHIVHNGESKNTVETQE